MTQTPPRRVLPILACASGLALLAGTIHAPAIPDMAREFGVPVAQAQFTLIVYFIFFAVGMLFVGPLSDRFGRGRTIVVGSLALAVASLGCALAATIEMLILGRVVQGVAGCAGMIVARATIRDYYGRDGTARALSAIAMAVAVAPVFAPILGGAIHVWIGWRWAFVLIAAAAMVVVAAVAWGLPSTPSAAPSRGGFLREMLSGFAVLLRRRRFIGYSLAAASASVCFYTFVATMPVTLIDHRGVRPDIYGLFAGLAPLGFMCGSFATNRLVGRLGGDRMIGVGGLCLLLAGGMAIGLALAGLDRPDLLIAPIFIMGFANGLTVSNSQAGAVNVEPQLVGAAAGLSGFAQIAIGSLVAAAVALAPIATALPYGLAMLTAGSVIVWLRRSLLR